MQKIRPVVVIGPILLYPEKLFFCNVNSHKLNIRLRHITLNSKSCILNHATEDLEIPKASECTLFYIR